MFCEWSPVWMWSSLAKAAKPARQRISLPFNRTTANSEKRLTSSGKRKISRQESQVRQCPEPLLISYRKKGREEGGKEIVCSHSSQLSRGMLAIQLLSHSHRLLSCRRGGIWSRMAWVTPWNWPKRELPRSDESEYIQPGMQDITACFFIHERLWCTCGFNALC